MRLHTLIVVLAGCVLSAMPAAAQEIQAGGPTAVRPSPAGIDVTAVSSAEVSALDRVEAAYPGILSYRDGSQLVRLYGRTFEMGDTPVQSAERFLTANADLFGAQAADLLPTTRILASGNTLPMMYDAETGSYKFTLIYHSQYRDGLPVFRSDVRTLVKNEAGYPLVWVGSSLKRLGEFHPDPALKSSVDPTVVAAGMVNFTAAEPVIWAGVDNKPAQPVQAVTFIADNYGSGADPEKWLYVVDAVTGAVLYQENQIVGTNVNGSVHAQATTLPKSAACNPEVDTVMPYAKVAIGTTTAYADANGNFTITNSGTSAVTVTSYMSGQYFTEVEKTGTLETLTMSVTPPGPANFMHNAADTDEHITAQVNAYIQANKVRDWLLTYKSNYPTISTQTGFTLNVNYNLTCNAYYDGSSLNFYLAGGGCANSAFSNVVHHEYGHHMCQCAGNGQDQYGEGVGDSAAVCIADDPVLGYGFENNCAAGIRTAANTMQYPCTSDSHTCAQLLSGCVWSTRNQLIATNPTTYLSILSNLFVNSIPLHSGSVVNPSIYTDWITLDGGTSGPHYAEITAGFQAHNMVPAAPPANDIAANAVVACPGTYSGTTSGATLDGSANCDGSSPGPDVWYKYTPGSTGSATIHLCTSGTTWDSVLSIHSGSPGTTSNQLNCSDDDCGSTGGHGTITRSVTGGTTYWIRIGGYASSNTGPFTLTITGPACASADSTPPSPNPMTFATAPAPAGTTSISMTASTATDPTTPINYFFHFVSGGSGGTDSAWQTGTAYTDTGLTPNTSYTYQVKARDGATTPNETSYSTAASTATLIETPTGVSFGTVTSNSIVLNATGTLTNLSTGSSGAYFNSTTTGGNGGINAWVQTTTDTATGLSPNTSYSFQVKARNQNSVETAYSATTAKVTLANVPTAPTLSGATRTTLNADVNVNGNPAATEFAVQCTGSTPTDANWNGKYVSAAGGASATAVWRTDAQWAVTTVTGLQACTTYTFAVKARNTELVETAFGAGASLATAGRLGDMTGDGVVDGGDMQAFVTCTISGGSGCACANMTISAFVDCLLNVGMCP